ncbi:MAG TPA: OsmC family protein [Xanthomonadales bacterium]|nr:OsmC family protein [Xanthomonadales bacterium]
MQAYPHLYRATANSANGPTVQISSPGLEAIGTASPAEFGGPGDRWSPETLLVAAVADCFILTFKAIAGASKFDWLDLQCEVEGKLDRVERVTRFTAFDIRARLTVPAGTDEQKARHILEKSEAVCLISNSLNGEKTLHIELLQA